MISFVIKKNDKLRLVLDCRRINQRFKDDIYYRSIVDSGGDPRRSIIAYGII